MSQPDFISTNGEVFPWQDIRLPSFAVPVDYSLHLQPDLVAFENTGSVKISFTVLSETDFIVLHVDNITVTQTKLFQDEEKEISVAKVLEYSRHQQMYVKANENLKPGSSYTLHIDFKYALKEKLDGFYLSSYQTSNGQKRYLVATHFEPTFARSAFPCFDEPSMKAKFTLKIVHKNEHKVYFNTEIKQSSPYGDDLTLTEFEKSVQMSTYLVAFIVCDFKEIECMNSSGIKIRVIAPAEQIHEAEYALTVASKVLSFYETLFGIKYPLSKLDMVAIPDFGSGAMENWGLITYRMVTILYNPLETSCTSQEHITMTITHELAHQWFGNLVTMEWWNDLWLNEGFARFVQYIGADHAQPDWNIMDQFTEEVIQQAMCLDGLETSHPIMVDVKDPYEIKSIFDRISYTKGASILYMLLDSLGMESLTKGLKYYLDKYRFRNAKTEDLWNSFALVTEAKQLDINKMMDTWTLQKGYPLLHVKYHNGHIKLHQERFLLAPPDVDTPTEASPFNYKWHIPVSYITNKDKNKKTFVLTTTDGEFSVPAEASWIKLNVNQTGFYHTMYDEEMWKVLVKQMLTDHTVFSSSDRSGLLDDALILARVGILKTDLAMDLTKYLEKEKDYVPWQSAITHFNYIYRMLTESPALPMFEKYVVKLLKPVVSSLGWKDEGSHLTKKLRSIALTVSLKCKDQDTIKATKIAFDNWMTTGESISPNLRQLIYVAGIRNGGRKEWEFCWNKYQTTSVASEKILLLMALSQTQDYWQLSQYLNYTLDKSKIRPQDVAHVIAYASLNPVGRLLTWRFVRMNWPNLLASFGKGFGIKTIAYYTTSYFNTKFDHDEVKSFFANIETGAASRDVQQGMENIRANVHFKENVEPSLIQWLRTNVTNA